MRLAKIPSRVMSIGEKQEPMRNSFDCSQAAGPRTTYEQHLRDNLINDLAELEGKVIGCWCKPEPCHGDLLVNLFKEKFIFPPQPP